MVPIELTLVEVMTVPADWSHTLLCRNCSKREVYESLGRIGLSIVETGVSIADMAWPIYVLVASKEQQITTEIERVYQNEFSNGHNGYYYARGARLSHQISCQRYTLPGCLVYFSQALTLSFRHRRVECMLARSHRFMVRWCLSDRV